METNQIHKDKGDGSRGFTLVELIIYVFVVTMIMLMVLAGLFRITQMFTEFRLTRDLNDSSILILEKVVREIRWAHEVDMGQSILGVDPGRLVMNSTDDAGDPVVIEVSVSGGDLVLIRDGSVVGSLTTDSLVVDEVIFDRVATVHSEAVKISLTLLAASGNVSMEKTFSTTAVLRESY